MVSKRQVVPIDAGRPVEPFSLEKALPDHLDGLYRFALRLTRHPDRAEELAQETVLRAWERRATIVRNLRAWLFQTLYHTFVSNRRHSHKDDENIVLVEEDAELQSLAAPLPSVIAMEDVRRAIEALPENLRTVVWLSDAEGLRLREIAEILGWPIGTVASRLWRAREELRKTLSDYGPPREKQP